MQMEHSKAMATLIHLNEEMGNFEMRVDNTDEAFAVPVSVQDGTAVVQGARLVRAARTIAEGTTLLVLRDEML